jgi:hypothetical protein
MKMSRAGEYVVVFRCEKILNEYTHSEFQNFKISPSQNTDVVEYAVVDKNITQQ